MHQRSGHGDTRIVYQSSQSTIPDDLSNLDDGATNGRLIGYIEGEWSEIITQLRAHPLTIFLATNAAENMIAVRRQLSSPCQADTG